MSPNILSSKFIMALTLVFINSFLLYKGKIDTDLYKYIVTSIVTFYYVVNMTEHSMRKEGK